MVGQSPRESKGDRGREARGDGDGEPRADGGRETRRSRGRNAGNQPPGTNVPAPWERASMVPFGWQPWSGMRNDFDRFLEPLFRGWPESGWMSSRDARWDVDVEERDEELVVRAEVPGFEPDDFDVQILGDRLTICACHQTESDEDASGSRSWHRHEFRRSIGLPPGIEGDKIDAKYKNGVLTVTLPKGEDGRGRRIRVKGG